MRKLSLLLLIVLISCNNKAKKQDAWEKVENKKDIEDSIIEADNASLHQIKDFEIFGNAFLKLVNKKDTNKLREYLLESIFPENEYSKISKDSFMSTKFIPLFDTYAIKNIKDKLDIHFVVDGVDKEYFYPSARAIIDSGSLYNINLFNETTDKYRKKLIILKFVHTKNGYKLYKYSILEFHSL